MELAKLRKQRLLDALSLYKLFNEADSVVTWIDEKVCTVLYTLSIIIGVGSDGLMDKVSASGLWVRTPHGS